MSLYGQLIKQEADYTALVDEKVPECEKLVEVFQIKNLKLYNL